MLLVLVFRSGGYPTRLQGGKLAWGPAPWCMWASLKAGWLVASTTRLLTTFWRLCSSASSSLSQSSLSQSLSQVCYVALPRPEHKCFTLLWHLIGHSALATLRLEYLQAAAVRSDKDAGRAEVLLSQTQFTTNTSNCTGNIVSKCFAYLGTTLIRHRVTKSDSVPGPKQRMLMFIKCRSGLCGLLQGIHWEGHLPPWQHLTFESSCWPTSTATQRWCATLLQRRAQAITPLLGSTIEWCQTPGASSMTRSAVCTVCAASAALQGIQRS